MQQTREDLENHLREQLLFMKASVLAFDAGTHAEAKRLALTIRLLVHNAGRSQGILAQLGAVPDRWYDTSFPIDPRNTVNQLALVGIAAGPSGARLYAQLDDCMQPARLVSFEDWWRGQVYRSTGGSTLNRSELVLAMCNKDGGAHVDRDLDSGYATLSRIESMGVRLRTIDGDRVMFGAELHAVRQIAHEVLRTLEPQYRLKPRTEEGEMLVAGMSMIPGTTSVATSPATREAAEAERGIIRNLPCHCGSGKQYKKCHGKWR